MSCGFDEVGDGCHGVLLFWQEVDLFLLAEVVEVDQGGVVSLPGCRGEGQV
jgi:hypothetical protein